MFALLSCIAEDECLYFDDYKGTWFNDSCAISIQKQHDCVVDAPGHTYTGHYNMHAAGLVLFNKHFQDSMYVYFSRVLGTDTLLMRSLQDDTFTEQKLVK